LYRQANPSGVCVASMLHYGVADIAGLKKALSDDGIKVRRALEGKS
jgi:hypothetical protein